MIASTIKMPTKIVILVLVALIALYAGFKFCESLFWYKFTAVKQIPAINKEACAVIDSAIRQEAVDRDWVHNGMGVVSVERIADVTNKVIADRLEYSFSGSTADPNTAWRIRKVNCSGYAAVQVAMLNHIFKEYCLDYVAEWHCGKVFWGNYRLGNIAKMLPSGYSGWQGGHCYTVVYHKEDVKHEHPWFPDACFYDVLGTGWLVSKEER